MNWEQAVTKLKREAKRKGLTGVQIARMAEMKQQFVSRMFSLKQCPSLKNYLKVKDVVDNYVHL